MQLNWVIYVYLLNFFKKTRIMGKVKLTLTIDDLIIENAKTFARSKKKSLSNLIEGLLKETTISARPVETNAQKLRGISKSKFSEMTDKEILESQMSEKYGV